MSEYGTRQRKVRNNVYEILETFPETRDSDKQLLIKYWEVFDEIDYSKDFREEFIAKASATESITRARRAIQSTGLFPPTNVEVLRKRRILAEEATEYHGQNREVSQS